MNDKQIFCKDCNYIFQETDSHCPKCGSEYKNIKITLVNHIKILHSLKMIVKDVRNKKPILELTQGDEFSYMYNKHVYKVREIDRKNNKYTEKIVDKETDEIIKDQIEPLDQHINHGSAKFKSKNRVISHDS